MTKPKQPDRTDKDAEDDLDFKTPGDEAAAAAEMQAEADALAAVQANAIAAENAAKGTAADQPTSGLIQPHDLAGLDWRHLTLAEAQALKPNQTVLTRDGYLIVDAVG